MNIFKQPLDRKNLTFPQVILIITTAVLIGYLHSKYKSYKVGMRCDEHTIATKDLMEYRQNTALSKEQLLEQISSTKSDYSEKQNAKVYIDKMYDYPLGQTVLEKEQITKLFVEDAKKLCILRKTKLYDL